LKLNTRIIKQLEEPGRYADGKGLYLHIRTSGSRQWLLRTTVQRKRVDIGLGSLNFVSLAEAREEAMRLLKQVKAGLDPLAERKRDRTVPTFSEAALTVWEQNLPTWKNKKHAKQWLSTLKEFATPKIGEKKIRDVTTAHILEVLTPIWTEKPETARRVRQRLRVVFDWAKASGFYSGDNPVDGVKMALPKQNKQPKHHTALPWHDLPDFMADLSKRTGLSARALTFLILTVGRSGEVRGAEWPEIDGTDWIIPAERMKMKRDHRVPLSKAAQAVVADMRGHSDRLIFPSTNNTAKPLSDMVFKALFKRMGYDTITAHGFRSTFRDWVADNDMAAREVAETSLAHQVGDDTERAYARSDILERRRILMEQWATYAFSKKV
jgi:integrase